MVKSGLEIGKMTNVLQEKVLSILMVEKYGMVNGAKV